MKNKVENSKHSQLFQYIQNENPSILSMTVLEKQCDKVPTKFETVAYDPKLADVGGTFSLALDRQIEEVSINVTS